MRPEPTVTLMLDSWSRCSAWSGPFTRPTSETAAVRSHISMSCAYFSRRSSPPIPLITLARMTASGVVIAL